MEFDYERIQAKTQDQFVDFIRNELQLARAAIRSAANAKDSGHIEEYQHAKAAAEKAREAARGFIDRIQDEQARSDIAQVAAELERLIQTI